uniref:Retrovirus-related Pol polyprotein from transposon TNT 1-94 n=1 Tax=Tanacetum cinerariifolium TaxID=118510 RepID=A0A6L2N7Z6_TANCI|nr:retrovirus-related Pol polyprotein from transposon TNT 1-94 [Tanacetum cinerariifolium]
MDFSVARTPQQNGIAKRKNRTLIKIARTMLADSLLPIPFWAEAFNTVCYVQNRVLVTKPHNKTSYELLLGRTPSIGFMRPFGCHVTILNTLDPLAKFDGKADEGFLVKYSVSIAARNQLISSEGIHENVNADAAAFKVKEPESAVHVSPSSCDKTKKHDDKTKREAKENSPVEFTSVTAVGLNSTNNTNTFSAAGPSNNTVSLNFELSEKSSFMDPSQYPDDLDMPALEDITYSDDEEDVGAEVDFSNLETSITVSRIPTTKVHKDHPVTQIIGDLSSAPQIRSMTRMVKQQGIEAIRLFLAYASFMGFMVYQMDVKSAFLYETIEEEVYVCQPPGFKDLDHPDKVYKVVKVLYGLHQAPRALDGKLASIPIDIEKPLLKDLDDSPFNLVAYSDSDYAGASLDRKSTTGGCQFLVGDLSSHTTNYTSPALTQKVLANMRRVEKGFSRVDTPLFAGMLVPQQAQDVEDAIKDKDDVNKVANIKQDKVNQGIEITKLKQRVRRLKRRDSSNLQGGCIQTRWKISALDADKDVTLEDVDAEVTMDVDVQGRLEESQAKVYHLDLEHVENVLNMQENNEAKHAEVEEVIEVVTAAKLMTKVVTTATTPITDVQVLKANAPRRRRGVIIQDPQEATTALVIVHSESDVMDQVKRKERQDNTVMRYQALKRKPVTEAHARKNMMIYLKNMAEFKMDFFREMTYNEIIPIFEKHYNLIQAFLERVEKEVTGQEEEGSKRKSESSKQRAAKKQMIDKETEELKTHIQIVPNDEDDVYIEATPLALKVPVVNYQIYYENNKPFYNIIRADGTHKLFLSFFTILKNFDREDLEMLWKLVQERFQSNIWREQKGRYGLANVKSWNLFQSCRVHIITFTTTQMILLVERKYPLTRFTLEQMLNNVILEVEEESEISLELLRVILKTASDSYYCQYKVSAVQIVSAASIVVNTVSSKIFRWEEEEKETVWLQSAEAAREVFLETFSSYEVHTYGLLG